MSSYVWRREQNVPAPWMEPDEEMVACPFAKAEPRLWLLNQVCCYRKPWKDFKTFIRHHTIGTHMRHNQKLPAGHPEAMDPHMFEELLEWSHKSKEWKTREQEIARWHEVYNIIAKWQGIDRPVDLCPEWTSAWLRRVLGESEPFRSMHHAVVNDDVVRHELKALVNIIKHKKKDQQQALSLMRGFQANLINWATQLSDTITAREAQYERDLHELKTLLKEKIRLHNCAHELLAQIEPDSYATPTANGFDRALDSAMDNDGVGHGDAVANMSMLVDHLPGLENFNASTSGGMLDQAMTSPGLLLQHLDTPQNPMLVPLGTSEMSSDTQSMPNSSAYFGTQHYSTNSTVSEPQDHGYLHYEDSKQSQNQDFQDSHSMDDISYADYLAMPYTGSHFHLE